MTLRTLFSLFPCSYDVIYVYGVYLKILKGIACMYEDDDLSEKQFYLFYSFKENTVFRLGEALSLPTRFVGLNGTLVSLTDGVQILLGFLLYPYRLNGMKTVFNSS